jgi:hypothetical protein
MATAVSDLVGVRAKLRAAASLDARRVPLSDADRALVEGALEDVERALLRVSELAGVAYPR